MPLPKEHIYTEDDYWNLPESVRAELINGRLYYLAAPSRIHQEISSELHTVINNYIHSKHGSCRVYHAPFAVKLRKDRDNTVEPDISVVCDRSKLTDRGCTGAPDWIIEIVSPANPGHDYVRKLNLYADAGVREYWIIDPSNEIVMVYYLEQERFQVHTYTFRDKITSNIFEDLTIDFAELIEDIPSEI
ncbi:MAG: Uma2 family endonuclease [Lachnospiraceae bacterium]|nr:Uma2 family endonuclease [Lachnospiraceae bacterium]